MMTAMGWLVDLPTTPILPLLEAVRRLPQREKEVGTAGYEAEGHVFDAAGRRVSVVEELGLSAEHGWTLHLPEGAVTVENWPSQIEISTLPFANRAEGQRLLDGLLGRLPPHWKIAWRPTDLSGLPEEPFFKPRHLAIERMVKLEGCKGGWSMGGKDAIHASLGVRPASLPGTLLLSAWTIMGPAIARAWETLGPDPGNRIGEAWLSGGGWGDPSRLPLLRIFTGPEDLIRQWQHSKRAVTLTEGQWIIDTRTSLPEWLDPEHRGTRWWIARPNGEPGTDTERCEFRLADAMHPQLGLEFTLWLRDFSRRILNTGELPFHWNKRQWQLARDSRSGWEELLRHRPDIIPALELPVLPDGYGTFG